MQGSHCVRRSWQWLRRKSHGRFLGRIPTSITYWCKANKKKRKYHSLFITHNYIHSFDFPHPGCFNSVIDSSSTVLVSDAVFPARLPGPGSLYGLTARTVLETSSIVPPLTSNCFPRPDLSPMISLTLSCCTRASITSATSSAVTQVSAVSIIFSFSG